MTITPTPEQEQLLTAAMEAGLIERPEDALTVGLERLQEKLAPSRDSETAEEWIRRFHAWIDSHSGSTTVLSDEALSRDSIYGDHGC
jgi:hypothetical protein